MDEKRLKHWLEYLKNNNAPPKALKTVVSIYKSNVLVDEKDFVENVVQKIMNAMIKERDARDDKLELEMQAARNIMKRQRRKATIPSSGNLNAEPTGSTKEQRFLEAFKITNGKVQPAIEPVNDTVPEKVQKAINTLTAAMMKIRQQGEQKLFDDALMLMSKLDPYVNEVMDWKSKFEDKKRFETDYTNLKAKFTLAEKYLDDKSAPQQVIALQNNYVRARTKVVDLAKGLDFSAAHAKLKDWLNEATKIIDEQKSQDDLARQAVQKDATAKVTAILNKDLEFYDDHTLNLFKGDLGDNKKSKFLAAMNKLDEAKSAKTFELAYEAYQQAKILSDGYQVDKAKTNNNKDVKKRLAHCLAISNDVGPHLLKMDDAVHACMDLCKSYQILAKKTQVPFSATAELQKLIETGFVSIEAKQKAKETIDLIRAEERKRVDALVNATDSDAEKAAIMEAHGSFKGTGGGTSDVKLMTNGDGSIAFAYKSLKGESDQALDFLGVKPGAGGMREAVSSKMHQDILQMTGLDLGFPKAEIITLNGEPGALIEGIKGNMADPEEVSKMSSKLALAPASEKASLQIEFDEMKKNLNEVPAKVSAKSMQCVLLSSMLTCQWDVKWGNMIVEGDTAHPLDAGTAIPTASVLDRFIDEKYGNAPPAFGMLLEFPPSAHCNRAGNELPIASDPLDPEIVDAIQKMDENKLIQSAKTARDQLVNDVKGIDVTMMDNSCFDIVAASIKGVKDIVKNNANLTTKEFVEKYNEWFLDWAVKYKKANQNQ